GPNGAGKTTTMKMITSFLDPNDGEVIIDGINVQENSLEKQKKIGYLPEMVPLYDELLVKEYLIFVAKIREIPKNKIRERVSEVMKECGLTEVINRPIDELSKGYRQRVGLAQAIIHEPDILILDEPTTGLDPNQIIEIRNLIKKIGQEKTIIFSTHILSEANAISDKIIIINKGKIVAEGTPQELQANAKAGTIYHLVAKGDKDKIEQKLRELSQIKDIRIINKEGDFIHKFEIIPNTKDDLREKIAQTVFNNSSIILEFSRQGASLEEIFIELTK
ncbi:MAG: ATP-binding cassette domain-containing protein, partial [Candidatus Falkowbacteria bacterium]|nr:ATP-binding cassette domain-containing protein [Candidatus Falkowbacteria bacterium]